MTTTQKTTHLMPAQQALLDESLSMVKDDLRRFLDDPNFEVKIGFAFGQLDAMGLDKMRSLIQDLLEAKGIPTIEILTAAEIKGAKGAFSATTETIYLSEVLFTYRNPVEISEILVEELGHYLDSQIKTEDSIGDEGAIFNALVQGDAIDEFRLKNLQSEDDHAMIELDGRKIQIEQATGEVTIHGTIKWKDRNGALHPLRDAKVEIWDHEDSFLDQKLETVYTNDIGYFSETLPNTDGRIGNETLDVYLIVYSEGKQFRVQDDSIIETIYSKQSIRVDDIPDGNGTLFNMTLDAETGSDSDDRAFSVHQAIGAGEYFGRHVGAKASSGESTLKIKFVDDPNTAFYRSSTQSIHLGKKYVDNWDVILHEYGHYLVHHDNLSNNPGGRHFFGISNISEYGKDKGVRLAWGEGLANYLAIAAEHVAKDAKDANGTSLLPNISRQFRDKALLGSSLDEESIGTSSAGEGEELSVARILWDIADRGAEYYHTSLKDRVALGHKRLYEILSKTKTLEGIERLDQLWDFFFKDYISLERADFLYRMSKNAERANFGAIFEEYNVSPRVVKFSDSNFDLGRIDPPTFKWERGNDDANDQFQVLVFNSDLSEQLFESGILNNVTEWTPLQNQWDVIAHQPGEYKFVVVGSDTTDFKTGGYWSGAHEFSIGQIAQSQPSVLLSGLTSFNQLGESVADFGQSLSNTNDQNVIPIFGKSLTDSNAVGIAADFQVAALSKSLLTQSNESSDDNPLLFLAELFTQLHNGFKEIFPDADEEITMYHIRDAFFEILGTYGLGVLQDSNESGDIDHEDIGLTIQDQIIKYNLPIRGQSTFDFDLPLDFGLSQLGLEIKTTNPDATVDLDYTLNIGLGIDLSTNEMFIDTSSSEDIVLSLDPTLSPLEAKLGFLNVDITDKNSQFEFVLDLDDGPNGDNILKLNEFSNLRITPNGKADINLGLLSKIDEDTPLFATDLELQWDFQDNGVTPDIALNNNTLYLGNFLSETIAPEFKKVSPFLDPIAQVTNILNQNIDVLSDFFGQDISLLSLAEAASQFGQGSIEGADTVRQVTEALQFINKLQQVVEGDHDDGGINLGDVDLSNFDLRNANASVEDVIVTGNSFNPNHTSHASANTLFQLQTIQRGLSLPILENPDTIAKLFLGNQTVDLFKYDLPTLDFGTSISAKLPILGPIVAKLEGGINASADLGFGFDSQGLLDWKKSGLKRDLLNGFYIDDNRGENGIDNPEALISGYLKASAGLDAYLASAFVGGGLEANLEFDLKDKLEYGDHLGESDGKIRATEIPSDPHCLFEGGGSLNANIFAEGKFLFYTKSKTWNHEIASFDFNCPHATPRPILGTFEPTRPGSRYGTLLLNAGDRAHLREHGELRDISEAFKVRTKDSAYEIEVEAFGVQDPYSNIKRIEAQGGLGNDSLEAHSNVLIPIRYLGEMGDDSIKGGSGDDTLDGGDGNDQISGGRGNDSLLGGDGNDFAKGGQGRDIIKGGRGDDILEGRKDDDQLFGESGHDFLEGESGNDSLDGGEGNDILKGGTGSDTVDGGLGSDTLSYGGTQEDFSHGVHILLDYGHAYEFQSAHRFQGAFTHDRISRIEHAIGSEGDDLIQGNHQDNQLLGGAGADILLGQGGDDVLDGGLGPDDLYGGIGDDLYLIADKSELTIEEQNEGDDTVKAHVSHRYRQWDLQKNVENLTLVQTDGSITSLTGYGNRGHNSLSWINQTGDDTFAPSLSFYGHEGNDLLQGDRNNDYLTGGQGDDTMIGGAGDDVYEVDSTADIVVEDALQGFDLVRTYFNNYSLADHVENLVLEDSFRRGQAFDAQGNALSNQIQGNIRNNKILALEGNDTVQGFAGNDVLNGGAGDDFLEGHEGDDYLYGAEGDDLLKGGEGKDVLNGGAGADFMEGEAGNDIYYIDTVDDVIVETAEGGIDKVRTSLTNYTLGEHLETLELVGNADKGYGNSLNNLLRGNDRTHQAETLIGGAGNDHIYGFSGNDSLSGEIGDDYLQGGEGSDSLQGDAGRDRLFGTHVGQVNPGEHEIDVLSGGADQDTFALGYSHNDQVFYAYGGDSDYAQITDFSDDIIQIKGSFEDYDLRIDSGGPVGANDTGIYFTKDGANDLIAVVENITTLDRSIFQELK